MVIPENPATFTVYDTNWNEKGTINNYISMIWTTRYDQPGEFSLVVPLEGLDADLFKEDYYIQMSLGGVLNDSTMIIEGMTLDADTDGGYKVTIAGHSAEQVLDRRICVSEVAENENSFIADTINGIIDDCFHNTRVMAMDRRLGYSPMHVGPTQKLVYTLKTYNDDGEGTVTTTANEYIVPYKKYTSSSYVLLNDRPIDEIIFSYPSEEDNDHSRLATSGEVDAPDTVDGNDTHYVYSAITMAKVDPNRLGSDALSLIEDIVQGKCLGFKMVCDGANMTVSLRQPKDYYIQSTDMDVREYFQSIDQEDMYTIYSDTTGVYAEACVTDTDGNYIFKKASISTEPYNLTSLSYLMDKSNYKNYAFIKGDQITVDNNDDGCHLPTDTYNTSTSSWVSGTKAYYYKTMTPLGRKNYTGLARREVMYDSEYEKDVDNATYASIMQIEGRHKLRTSNAKTESMSCQVITGDSSANFELGDIIGVNNGGTWTPMIVKEIIYSIDENSIEYYPSAEVFDYSKFYPKEDYNDYNNYGVANESVEITFDIKTGITLKSCGGDPVFIWSKVWDDEQQTAKTDQIKNPYIGRTRDGDTGEVSYAYLTPDFSVSLSSDITELREQYYNGTINPESITQATSNEKKFVSQYPKWESTAAREAAAAAINSSDGGETPKYSMNVSAPQEITISVPVGNYIPSAGTVSLGSNRTFVGWIPSDMAGKWTPTASDPWPPEDMIIPDTNGVPIQTIRQGYITITSDGKSSTVLGDTLVNITIPFQRVRATEKRTYYPFFVDTPVACTWAVGEVESESAITPHWTKTNSTDTTNSTADIQTYEIFGQKFAPPKSVETEGANMIGWKDSNGYWPETDCSWIFPYESAVTVTAQWEELYYPIVWYANGGNWEDNTVYLTDVPDSIAGSVYRGVNRTTEVETAASTNQSYSDDVTSSWSTS